MAQIRPDVHCSHIGPTGGAFCNNDRTYDGIVEERLFTHSPMIAWGYGLGNKSVTEL